MLEELLEPQEQLEAIRQIDASVDQWRSDLSRRTQHYGWRYDYRNPKRVITPDMYLGQLPPWLDAIAQRILEQAVHPETGAPLFSHKPEQAIINEYVGSQGISEHSDAPGFGPAIATVSLISEWDMLFAPRYRGTTTAVAMPVGSCITMTGPSRATWTHQIPRDRGRAPSARRLSLTFRTILNRDTPNRP